MTRKFNIGRQSDIALNKEIYQDVFGEITDRLDYKHKYESIRMIRNKNMFCDISKDYNF